LVEKKSEEKYKGFQVRLPIDQWKFLSVLASVNETTLKDLIFSYVQWLMEGNPPVGYKIGLRADQVRALSTDAKTQ